jgi:hypothetical protein
VITDLHRADHHTITDLFRTIGHRISAFAQEVIACESASSDQRERNVGGNYQVRSAGVEHEG